MAGQERNGDGGLTAWGRKRGRGEYSHIVGGKEEREGGTRVKPGDDQHEQVNRLGKGEKGKEGVPLYLKKKKEGPLQKKGRGGQKKKPFLSIK